MSEDQYYALLALVAAVMGWRRYVARPRPVTEEAELLARTMYAETSGRQKHPDQELAAIGYVGLNRARDGYTLAEVLTPPGRSDYGVWNASRKYRDRWYTADSKAGYQRCIEVAEAILAGTMPNPIGGRALFYHPAGLKRCTPGDDVGERWVCVSTHAGNRRVPRWGLRNPIRVGDAVFCGDP